MRDEASRLAVTHYHERTKHRPGRLARSLGYLDWQTQPNPFRWYDGCQRIPLEREEPTAADPAFDGICAGVPPAPLDWRSLSQLLYDSFDARGVRAVDYLGTRGLDEVRFLGQILYLEAEAANLRGTGIGCYFDDVVHEGARPCGSSFSSHLSLCRGRTGRRPSDPCARALSSSRSLT